MFRRTFASCLLALGASVCLSTGARAACPLVPDTGCRTAELSQFVIRIKAGTPEQNRLTWKWKNGDSFSHGDLGDPLTDTDYVLCVYDSKSSAYAVATELAVPASALWVDRDPKGWRYSDKIGTNAGVQKVQLKPGDSKKASVQWKAKGASVPLPPPASATKLFSQDPGVIVQLQKQSGSGPNSCWTSGEFGDSDTSRNDPSGFSGRNQ